MNNINKLTEVIAVDDRFYMNGFEDFVDELTQDQFEENDSFEFSNCIKRKVINIDRDGIWNMLARKFEDNTSEDGDEWEYVEEAFNEMLSPEAVDRFVDKVPSLWWPEGPTITVSKDELVSYMLSRNISVDDLD